MRISDWSSDVCSSDLTDFGPGSMTESGYARIVKEWKRGTPLESATLVYEGKAIDMAVGAGHDDTPGYERDFVYRALAFYNDELYLRGEDGKLAKVDVPNSAQKSVQREWLGLELREPWEVGGKTYKAGSFRSEEHTSELQSLMRTSYAGFCL